MKIKQTLNLLISYIKLLSYSETNLYCIVPISYINKTKYKKFYSYMLRYSLVYLYKVPYIKLLLYLFSFNSSLLYNSYNKKLKGNHRPLINLNPILNNSSGVNILNNSLLLKSYLNSNPVNKKINYLGNRSYHNSNSNSNVNLKNKTNTFENLETILTNLSLNENRSFIIRNSDLVMFLSNYYRRTKFKFIYMKYSDFNTDSFIDFIMNNLKINRIYSILIKLNYKDNRFFMAGRQLGLCIRSNHDETLYKNYYEQIQDRIKNNNYDYFLEDNPSFILIMFREVEVPNELLKDFNYNINSIDNDLSNNSPLPIPSKIIKNIKNLDLNNGLLSITAINKNFNSNLLALSTDHSHFGYLMEGKLKKIILEELKNKILSTGLLLPEILLIDSSNLNVFKKPIRSNELIIIERIFYNFSSFSNNYISRANYNYLLNNKLLKLDLNSLFLNFYLSNSDLKILNLSEKEFKLLSLDFNKIKLARILYVYDKNSGLLNFDALDFIEEKDTFTRKIKNTLFYFKEGRVSSLKQIINLNSIKTSSNFIKIHKKISDYKGMSDPNFGALDLETYVDSDGLSKVYCLGFTTYLDRTIKTYYISDFEDVKDSNSLILRCINEMLITKYHNYKFYVHNLGNFDVIFIYTVLSNYNKDKGYNYYNLKPIFRDDKIIKLSISIKSKNQNIKITLIDSYCLLTASLDTLAKDFQIEASKGVFPYNFVNSNTFNYVGETPAFEYYSKISYREYKEKYLKNDWNLREEALKYLEKDLILLLEVLIKFNKNLFLEHNLQMNEGLTISRLALNLFFKNYLKDNQIPLINKSKLFHFIYFGYFGGITEVYKPLGHNLKYYDVNSLYPFASLNPMPGLACYYVETFDDKGLNLEDLFGFFYAKVKTNNQYLGLLPVKTSKGIINPEGEFTGVWSSEELKFAKKYGYDIIVTKGYNFNKITSPFTKYVKDLYKIKSESSGSIKAISKSLLNNLIGRLGMNIYKPITEEVNNDKYNYILTTRRILNVKEINVNKFLITYLPLIDEKVCLEHGLDYIKVLNSENNIDLEKKIEVFKDVSIATSAMVTSYARIYMNQVKIDILNKGGNIYYTDTDSIVTDIDLESLSKDLVGGNLGQFKLEYEIEEGIFISNKTYCLKLKNGNVIIKAKGVLSKSLTYEDFLSMLHNSEKIRATKKETIKDYNKGSVTIQEKEILLDPNSFQKREKIYESSYKKEIKLWIDTKPLNYNNLNNFNNISNNNHSNNK